MSKIKGWDFPIKVDKETGKIKTIEDYDNIKRGVYIILNTNNYEMKWLPEFGADIRPLLFKEISSTLLGEIERRVRTAIKMWEKHVKSVSVDIDISRESKGKVYVSITYFTDLNDYKETVVQLIDVNNADENY